jgi:hypothetical protein
MITGSRLIVVNASHFENGGGYWITPEGRIDTAAPATGGGKTHDDYAQTHYGMSRYRAIQKGYTRVNTALREINVEHNGTLNPNAAQHLIPEMAAHIRRGGRAFVNQKEVHRISDIMVPKETDYA